MCAEYEESKPCEANSHCSLVTGSAECICNDEHEDDGNAGCSRIDPCNSYNCTISNSFCTNLNDVAVCGCDDTHDTYVLNNGMYETTDLYFNDSDSQSLK